MTKRIYLTPLPEADGTRRTDQIDARIEQTGLLEQGDTAVEPIATENVDHVEQGQFRDGELITRKLTRELESLNKSNYTAIPLFDDATRTADSARGYYEIADVQTNPAAPITEAVGEYQVTFNLNGTRKSHWRAVTTNSEPVQTGLATGESGLIGIPRPARNVRWFDPAEGTETATVHSTVTAELGTVDRYDPDASTFADPTLLYSVRFDYEGQTDVRVYDDSNREKFITASKSGSFQYDTAQYDTEAYAETTARINQWTHAYHSGFEFDGLPVVDNGLLRIRFDDLHGTLEAFEYDSGWSVVPIEQGDYRLEDADIERVGPAVVDVYTEWRDTSDDVLEAAVLSIQRGLSGAIVRQADNDTLSAGLESVLEPFASEYATDPRPTQTLKSREDAK